MFVNRIRSHPATPGNRREEQRERHVSARKEQTRRAPTRSHSAWLPVHLRTLDHLKDARCGLVEAGQRQDCHLGDRCGRLLSWFSSNFMQAGGRNRGQHRRRPSPPTGNPPSALPSTLAVAARRGKAGSGGAAQQHRLHRDWHLHGPGGWVRGRRLRCLLDELRATQQRHRVRRWLAGFELVNLRPVPSPADQIHRIAAADIGKLYFHRSGQWEQLYH